MSYVPTRTVVPLGVAQGSITSVTLAITTSAQTITFSAASSNITIWTDAAASDIYIQLNGSAATTSCAKIQAGGQLFLSLPAGITSISILGAGSSGNVNVVAF